MLVVGRHRQAGEREPNGRLKRRKTNKPEIEPMSGALFQRLRQNAKRAGIDPRILTELGRLNWDGELTLAQTAAGLRIAEIYGRYEGYKRKGRNVRSPSYNASYGEAGVAEELLDAKTMADLESKISEATAAWIDLVGRAGTEEGPPVTGKIPPKLRAVVEQLCVEDRHISPVYLDEVRMLLQGLVVTWKIHSSVGGEQQPVAPANNGRHGPPLHFNRHEEPEKLATAAPAERTEAKRPNLDRIFFVHVARAIAPHLSTEQIGEAYDFQQALKQREIFRRSKEKRHF